jgi:hypothetical protein
MEDSCSTLRTGRACVLMRDARVFANSVNFEGAGFGGDAVDVHRTVATLRGDKFIERIPCDTLDVMVVLGDLGNTFT